MRTISPNVTKVISISQDPLIPATDIATYLNLAPTIAVVHKDLIDEMTNAATETLSKYLWLSLKRTTYEAYYSLDYSAFYTFLNSDLALSIERSPIISLDDITKIEYLENDQWVEFDRGVEAAEGLFDNTTERIEQRGWASIYFKEGITLQNRLNAYKIRITFVSGFLDSDPVYFIPPTLKLALKKIVAYHYTNRGDCASDCDINGFPVPCGVMGAVDLWHIGKTVLGGSYNPSC